MKPVAINRWQPISTLPEDGKQYLVRSADGKYSVLNKPEGCFIGEWEEHNGEWYGHSIHGNYTHWREI